MLPAWRDIVVAVARQAGVEDEHRATTLPVWRIEQATLRKAMTDWERLAPEQREEVLKKAGIDINAAWGGVAAAAGGLVRLGGEQLLAFLAARGAGYALAATIFAPVATVLGAIWTAHDLAGPSQRVLRPLVLTIAHTRQRLRETQSAAAFQD